MKNLIVLILFVLLVVAFLFDVLIGDNILLTDNPYHYQPWSYYASDEDLNRRANRVDSFRLFLPYAVDLSRAVRDGRVPLWTPDARCGRPFLADPQARVFYPPSILLALVDPLDAMGYDIAIHLLIALLGMYLFLRSAGTTYAGAMIGAIAYGFSSCFFAGMVHPTAIASASWMPFYFYAFERARMSAVSGILLLAGFLTLGYLGCHPQVYLLTITALVVYVIHTAVEDLVGGSPRRALGSLRNLGIAGCLALLMAALQLLPFLEFLGNSTGMEGEVSAAPRPFNIKPLLMASTLFPNLFGNPVEGTRWIRTLVIGGHRYGRSLLAYCGVGSLLAAVCSAFFVRYSRHIRALLLLLVLALCLAISPSVLNSINSLSPLPGSVGLGRLFIVVCFAIAAPAGLGFSAMSSSEHARSKRRALLLAGCIVVLILAVFAVLIVAGNKLLPRMVRLVEGSVETVSGVRASEVFLGWLNSQPEKWLTYEIRQVGLGLIFAVVSFIVLLMHCTGLARVKRLGPVLAVVFLSTLAVDLGLAARSYYVSQPRSSVFETEGIVRLQDAVGREGRWRIMNLDDKRDVLTPNTNLIFGISSLQGNYRLIPESISDITRGKYTENNVAGGHIGGFNELKVPAASFMSVRFMPAKTITPTLLASPVLRVIARRGNLRPQLRIVRAGNVARLAFCQVAGDSLTLGMNMPPARWLDFGVALSKEGEVGCDSLTVFVRCGTELGGGELSRGFDLSSDTGRWHRMRMDVSAMGKGAGTLTMCARPRGTVGSGDIGIAWSEIEFVAGDCEIMPAERGYEIAVPSGRLPISIEIASEADEVPLEVLEDGSPGPTRWVDFSGSGGLRHLTLALEDINSMRIRLESDSCFSITACKNVYPGAHWSPGFELWHDRDMLIFENLLAVEKGICIDKGSVTIVEDGRHSICQVDGIENPARIKCGECSTVMYEPERVELRVRAHRDCYLVLQDSYYPGWKAWIDDRPVEILMTRRGIRAIEMPTGEHAVIFEFRPESFRLGLMLTSLGLLFSALFAWKGSRLISRRPR